MGLDEVIAFLAQNGLEGVLTIAGVAVHFQLYIHDGRILFPYASSKTPQGRVPREDLDAIRRRAEDIGRAQARPDPRGRVQQSALARILARSAALPSRPGRRRRPVSGRISREDLNGILSRATQLGERERRAQLTEEIHDLFRWREAHFRFNPRRLPRDLVQTLEQGEGLVLEPTALLMEVARRADERRDHGGTRSRPRPRAREKKAGTRITVRPARRGGRPKAGTRRKARAENIQGDLDGVGLAAVLETLRTNRRTGTLEVSAQGSTERIYFHKGEAFVLRLNGQDEAFVRDFLGESGTLAVNGLARHSIDEADLSEDAQDELKDRFFGVLLWEGATFCFRRGELPLEFYMPSANTTKVALQTDRFLLQAIGRISEWEELREVLGGARAVLRFRNHAQKLTCVRQVADYLTLLDGRLDFAELVRRTGVERLEAARVCVSLLHQGVLERALPRRTKRA